MSGIVWSLIGAAYLTLGSVGLIYGIDRLHSLITTAKDKTK